MTGAPESAPAVGASAAIPADVLDGGEIVLLVLRPSPWFIALVSWPVVLLAAAAAAAAWWVCDVTATQLPARPFVAFCVAIGAVRLLVASFQWLRRLYVLTNRRVMWITGLSRVAVYQCPLGKLKAVRVVSTAGERVLGLGTLVFGLRDAQGKAEAWVNVPRPQEVAEAIERAIGKGPR